MNAHFDDTVIIVLKDHKGIEWVNERTTVNNGYCAVVSGLGVSVFMGESGETVLSS